MDWLTTALEALQEQCLSVIETDVTLWKVDEGGVPELPEVIEVICPGDCNKQGQCINGEWCYFLQSSSRFFSCSRLVRFPKFGFGVGMIKSFKNSLNCMNLNTLKESFYVCMFLHDSISTLSCSKYGT